MTQSTYQTLAVLVVALCSSLDTVLDKPVGALVAHIIRHILDDDQSGLEPGTVRALLLLASLAESGGGGAEH